MYWMYLSRKDIIENGDNHVLPVNLLVNRSGYNIWTTPNQELYLQLLETDTCW